MNSEREIVKKLLESKELEEASFEANGSTYKCVFGKYYQDGEEITRDAYFKAKDGGSVGTSSKGSKNSKGKDQHQAPQKKSTDKLKFDDVKEYPYQFSIMWKGAPNSTYADDLLDLAEEHGCLKIQYNDGRNNTKFICKDKSEYENLSNALSQNKILGSFMSLNPIKDMDWDDIGNKVEKIYVDKYSGGYSVRTPKKRR